jgi:hypothetical protein
MPDTCAHYMPEKYTVTDNRNGSIIVPGPVGCVATHRYKNHDAGTAGSALFCRFPSQEFNIV